MSVPFFDSNPEIVRELKEMDHGSKEYRKHLKKILLDIGGPANVLNYLKEYDEGKCIGQKYKHSVIASGVSSLLLFVWIFLTVALTGGKETDQFGVVENVLFLGFLIVELWTIVSALFFAFRGRKLLLKGVSFLIDNDTKTEGAVVGSTLEKYAKDKSRANKTALITVGVIFVFAMVGILLSSGLIENLFSPSTKEFAKAGLTITLPRDFEETEVITQTAAYMTNDYLVLCLKEEFAILEQYGISHDTSLHDYAQAVIDNNAFEATIQENKGSPYFVYSREMNGKNITYLTTVYKGGDAFWTVSFACESEDYQASQEKFLTWSETVKAE